MVIGIKSALVADLNIKAILDGVISIVLTSIYGVGVIFSAFSVFAYQGIFYLFASQIKDFLTPQAYIRVKCCWRGVSSCNRY